MHRTTLNPASSTQTCMTPASSTQAYMAPPSSTQAYMAPASSTQACMAPPYYVKHPQKQKLPPQAQQPHVYLRRADGQLVVMPVSQLYLNQHQTSTKLVCPTGNEVPPQPPLIRQLPSRNTSTQKKLPRDPSDAHADSPNERRAGNTTCIAPITSVRPGSASPIPPNAVDYSADSTVLRKDTICRPGGLGPSGNASLDRAISRGVAMPDAAGVCANAAKAQIKCSTAFQDGVASGTATESHNHVYGQDDCPHADKEGDALRQPSYLIDWDIEADKLRGAERRAQAKQHLEKIKDLLILLERAVDCEASGDNACAVAVTQAANLYRNAVAAIQTCSAHTCTRLQQLDEYNAKHKLLMAESLPDCSNASLDEISDSLSAGLQAATIALSRRQVDNAEVEAQQAGFEFFCKTLPEPVFSSAVSGAILEGVDQSEVICSRLIEQFQELRTLQAHGYAELQRKDVRLRDLQSRIVEKNDQYNCERQTLEGLEHKLDNRIRQVNRLSGTDDYAGMTSQALGDLCRQINKASRRIATEQALREIRAANTTEGGLQGSQEKELCVVCFEKRWNTTLSPCGHVLCDECGRRLNYCPQCRSKIVVRNKCQQP